MFSALEVIYRTFVVTVEKIPEDLALHQNTGKTTHQLYLYQSTNHKISEEKPIIEDRPKQAHLELVTTQAVSGDLIVDTQILLKSGGLLRSSLSLLTWRANEQTEKHKKSIRTQKPCFRPSREKLKWMWPNNLRSCWDF